jgi:Fe-S-cluster containining protein
VFLSEKDADLLAVECQMPYADFVKTYCRWVPAGYNPDGNGEYRLSLKEKSGFDCIFWKDGCLVYNARPLQCRTFPFWESVVGSSDSWELTKAGCPGMGKGELHSMNAIQSLLDAQTKAGLIIKKQQNPEAR